MTVLLQMDMIRDDRRNSQFTLESVSHLYETFFKLTQSNNGHTVNTIVFNREEAEVLGQALLSEAQMSLFTEADHLTELDDMEREIDGVESP